MSTLHNLFKVVKSLLQELVGDLDVILWKLQLFMFQVLFYW